MYPSLPETIRAIVIKSLFVLLCELGQLAVPIYGYETGMDRMLLDLTIVHGWDNRSIY